MHRDPAGGSLPGAIAHRAAVLSLQPLTQNEAAAMLSAAVEEADPAAVRRAAGLSGGSPLYLATLARVAVQQLRGRTSWDDAVGEAPELRHLVAAAMRAAGPDAAGAIGTLSVLGPEADLELATRLLSVGSPGAAIELLLSAVPAGLVEPLSSSSTQVRFAHALVRSAVYASLPPERRAASHRRAATLLEPLAIARDDRAGAVAQHWDRGGEPGRAIKWAIRAADAARAAGANDEAVSYLELAVGTVDGAPTRMRSMRIMPSSCLAWPGRNTSPGALARAWIPACGQPAKVNEPAAQRSWPGRRSSFRGSVIPLPTSGLRISAGELCW
jgi:predicted ATPase